MKNRKFLCMVMLLLMFGIVGCDSNEKDEPEKTTENDDVVIEYQDEDEEIIVMTDEEKAILCSTYVNEDRINEGKLYDYQIEALKQFRYAKEYLQKKYPGYEYNFFAFHPESKTDDITKLEFTVDDTEHYFTVEVHASDEGYQGKDNLYGYILSPEFEAMVVELLADAGIDNCLVHAKMGTFVGEEIDADTTVEEIVDMGRSLKIDLQIFVDMEGGDNADTKAVVTSIEEQLRSINNYGGHQVYFAPGITAVCSNGDECIEYRKEHDLYFESFNTFDE